MDQLGLTRPHVRTGSPLRAWDAADELAVDHLAEAGAPVGTVAVVDDAWGALACSLAGPDTTTVCDSAAGRATIAANLERLGRSSAVVADVTGLPGRIDVAVVRIPRSLVLFEDRLRELAPRLHADSLVVCTAMVKHLPRTAHEVTTRVLGPTRPSMTRRKARLLLVDVVPGSDAGPWPWPRRRTEGAVTVVDRPGVFSAGRLDAGSRLLLANLPEPTDGVVVDLGCGDGLLAAAVAIGAPDAHLTLVDDSHLAVASARETWSATHGDRPARFVEADALGDDAGVAPASVDLVLCNPPFHEGAVVGDDVAWRMFTGAHRALRPGGELRIVGNRHLGYHAKLRRLFGNVEVVASDARFVVLSARR